MDDPRRARILTCAQEVFASEGFRSAEVKTIAERAGVGKASRIGPPLCQPSQKASAGHKYE